MARQHIVVTFPPFLAPPPAPLDNGAKELVTSGFATANTYASEAFDRAASFLDEIVNIAEELDDLPPIDVEMQPIFSIITPYEPPVKPDSTELDPNFAVAPIEPTIEDVAPIDTGTAPILSAVPPAIDLDIPLPSDLSAVPPTAPDLTAVTIPDDPVVNLPDVPTLLGISIPSAPTVTLPDFTAVMPIEPTDSSITPFSFTEPAYGDALLDAVKARLYAFVNGESTGLEPDVENAIWDRARDREYQTARTGIDEISVGFAARGFTMPQGAMLTALSNAYQNLRNKVSGLSRDIMIKQAELEQENRKAAFVNAINLEGQLLTYSNNIANRAFEVAKFASEVGVSILNARVALFNASVQAYVANVTAYKARIEAELAKLEIFKAELEGQKLIGELNLQNVQIYKERVNAALAEIEIFKAKLSAVELVTKVDTNRIEAFKGMVSAYGEQVRAKASEYDMYATRVKAEASKVDIYRSQVDAYTSEVTAFATLIKSKIEQQAAEIKYKQEAPIELFKAKIAAYGEQIKAEASRLESLASIYESEIKSYSAEIDGEAKRVGAETDAYKAEVEYKTKEATLRMEEARMNLATLQQSIQLLLEAIKGGSSVAAQLAASAMSAVNLSASVSDSNSKSAGIQHSNQTEWRSDVTVVNDE